ncbi:MAG: hypothetical protein LBQ88_18640 [Treponema sp.]|jgi:hypothetical protein|nr:hypothetical protein [Treponema sp.]
MNKCNRPGQQHLLSTVLKALKSEKYTINPKQNHYDCLEGAVEKTRRIEGKAVCLIDGSEAWESEENIPPAASNFTFSRLRRER